MKESAWICLWLSFLILWISRSLTLDAGTSCTAVDKRIFCDGDGGSHSLYCDSKMSKYCDRHTNAAPKYCYDTLHQFKVKEICEVKKLNQGEGFCGTIIPSHVTPSGKSLIELRLYNNEYENESVVNVTLLNPTWEALELQYFYLGSSPPINTCRFFTLHQAVNGSLMYDCRIRSKFKTDITNFLLTVRSDTGQGASFLYKVPMGSKVNPKETCPTDWHTFFYIHQDAILSYEHLAVTVQSSPYDEVKYNISLARCRDVVKEECINPEVVEHKLITKNTSDDLWTVKLSPVTAAGNYTVRVQINAHWCPKKEGCYVSVSPRFEIPPDPTLLIILIIIIVIFMAFVSMLIMFYWRRRVNRGLIDHIQNNQPSVLLVYHPESQAALSFVKTFAEFLRKTCYVKTLMADEGVGSENPTYWTKKYLNDANRVLFIIPKNPEAESITTIRNLFKVALIHCIGHEFTTSSEYVRRVAKLVHPASGDVPNEIRNIRRFELTHNPAALANWLHDMSFLDWICFWLPHIWSFTKKNFTPTWTDVMLAAKKIDSQVTATNDQSPQASLILNMVEIKKLDDSEPSDGDDNESSSGMAFDPEIPDVNNTVCEPSDKSILSPENPSDEDDVFQ